jgi:glycosyltransferase involved in cell wall biosynthesis
MLSLDVVPAVKYVDPWNISLFERLRILARGRIRIAYFYEQADNSTFRYRTYNMVQVLNDDKDLDFSASYFFLQDLQHLSEIADFADMLVLCRTRYDNRINYLITAFRKRGKRVLFDIDDLIFNIDYIHLILTTLDQNLENPKVWDDWLAYSGRIAATLRLCDSAITTNAYLAQKISEFANIPTSVIPNFLNREQLDISDRIFTAKRSIKFGEDGSIHLGYFSGSPSHNKDFAIVTPALEALLEEDSRLGVIVVGYIALSPKLKRFGSRVKHVRFHDFINLQRLIGSVEFNLMPLQFNVFTNCKSELKYFEAAIVGTQSIASPVNTYAAAIRHEDNGYLSQAHQWEKTIRLAVSKISSYQEMAERAYEDALTKYGWLNQRDHILSALGLQ